MSAFTNPYAPPWMGFTPVIKGIRDREYDLDLPPVAVPANSFVLGTDFVMDGDTDYLVREFQFLVTSVTINGTPSIGTALASDIRIRIRDGRGRLFTSDFIPISDLNGPLCPPWPIPRGSVLVIDYQNINQTGSQVANVWMCLKGWKRYQCANDQKELTPAYTPMYRMYPKPQPGEEFSDFEYPFTFTSAVAVDLLKLPLQTDNDAGFWWSGISGDWNTANNDVAVVGNVGLTFYDAVGLPMMQAGLKNPWNSPIGALFRESVLSSGGARPAPFWPAIYIPRGGVVQVDISFGQAATVRFSLRGTKVYEACR
jgi:hypothetical protein